MHPSVNPFFREYRQKEIPQEAQEHIAKTVQTLEEVAPNTIKHLNPIHAIPKGNPEAPRGWRIIVNNSWPPATSVNDLIPDYFKRCELPTFQQVLQWLMALGSKAFVAAIDLTQAWKQLRIAPEDRWMLCWQYNGKFYQEKGLPFGLAIAVRLFTIFNKGYAHAVKTSLPATIPEDQLGTPIAIHYIDDITMGARSEVATAALLQHYLRRSEELGLRINAEKTQTPTQTPLILGFDYDLKRQTISIPDEKRQRLRGLLERTFCFFLRIVKWLLYFRDSFA